MVKLISTLNGARRELERFNKPVQAQEFTTKRRVASKALQLEVWTAMIDWFSGDHSEAVRSKLVWQPAGALGHLLPQLPAYQEGDDWRVRSCQSEHYKYRYRISMAAIIEEWLNEHNIPAEELKKSKWLKRAIREASDMITLPDEEWGPVLEHHNEYYKRNPNPTGGVLESWTFLYSTYRIHVSRHSDGRLTKNKNNEEDVNSPDWNPPSRRPKVEIQISPAELLQMVNDCKG